MKSIIATFLIFIFVFMLMKLDVLTLVDNSFFRIGTIILFITVVGCAVFFVGIPDFDKSDVVESDEDLVTNRHQQDHHTKKQAKKGQGDDHL